jgi:tetratricopeptide (TPR) repeat protein/tRNA A-37 threonylcarbamoyl transferase component Bud32
MIGKTISHYKIIEKIGEGGMGVVYKARDTKLDRVVALKFLPAHLLQNEEAKTRFIQEAKAASALDHPNIATVHDIDEIEGETFISMAFIEGVSLKKIAASEKLSIQKVIDVAVQAAEGLGAAHKKDIVHRDVKSDNIMVTGDNLVKLMDFGLAKLKGVPGVTRDGSTVGTAHYMSPEQAKGEEVDHRSDIFSFGVVLFELVTGQFPFAGEYEPAVAYSIVNEPPRSMRELRPDAPAELEAIVNKAMEKDPADRYQSMDELIADLRKLIEGRTAEITAAMPAVKTSRGLGRRILVPALVLAAVAVALVVGIRIQIGRQPPAEASDNVLAVMYFQNIVDEEDTERLGEIITNLVITDLSESRYFKVVSSQRLYDILKRLGKEGVKVIDEDVATQIAREAGARWMLTGTILQTKPRIRLTATIEEVGRGTSEKSQSVIGDEGEDIFSVVDRLTHEVREDLELPDEAMAEPDPPVAEVTTASPDAYRHYLEGIDYFEKAYLPEAQESFLRALEYDSTFAMAHFRLAMTYMDGQQEMAKESFDKAYRYSDGVTRKEQLYIKAFHSMWEGVDGAIENLREATEAYPDEKEAYYWLGSILHAGRGDSEGAIPYLKKAIEIDPLYKTPYNMLAYAYERVGDFDKAIWAINKYISLAPDEANPYDTRGELYGYSGRIDQAIDSFEKALEVKPDFSPALTHLGHMYMFERDYLMAESYYKILASSDDAGERSYGRAYQALIQYHKGKFEEGIAVLDEGIAKDREEGVGPLFIAAKHGLKAHGFEALGDLESAVEEMKTAVDITRNALPDIPTQLHGHYGHLLAAGGRWDEADEIAEEVKEAIERLDPSSIDLYWRLLGDMELIKGNADKALYYLERADSAYSYAIETEFSLAQALLETGRAEDAASVLEKRLERYSEGRAGAPIKSVKLHYLLGMAYEESGQAGKAVEQYEIFLDIWKDADPGINEIEDAKVRLERLKTRIIGSIYPGSWAAGRS